MTKDQGVGRRQAIVGGLAAAAAIWPTSAQASSYKRLDTALAEMKEAKAYLKDAPAKFGGHRKAAIDALTTAIDEIEKAIKFAK